MAQISAEVEPGSDKGSIIATIGMGVSIVINTLVLTIGVIAGSSILSMLPASVVGALNYLLPALFGALLVQFGMKNKSHTVLMLVIGILLNIAINGGVFSWLPGANNYLSTLVCVFSSIAIMMVVSKKKAAKAA